MKKIAVLTSGGDAPGMNACIYNLFVLCNRNGIELYGVQRGYQGLIDNDINLLTYKDVENSYSLGGSVLKSARSPEFRELEGKQKAFEIYKKHEFDALIVIGGNGSYRGAKEFSTLGANVICLPGTIDNDLNYTEKSLGFDTAVNNSVSAIDKIKDTMTSNDRGAVIEVMGRHSGDIALNSATASNADAVVVEEVPHTITRVIEDVKRAIVRGVESPIVIVSENILNIEELASELENRTGKIFKTTVLGYIQRGGNPTVYDRNFAMELAVKTIDLLQKGYKNRSVGTVAGNIIDVKLKEVEDKETNFDFELYSLFRKLND